MFLALLSTSCFQAKKHWIEPISEKPLYLTPTDSLIFQIKIEPISIKIDSLKIIFAPINTSIVVTQDSVKKEIGEQIFEFYETSSPDILFYFPSHSVVMIQGDVNKMGVANSFCEYWLYSKTGKLVCHCKNTVSGLHPVYANSFNANNHLPEYTKKISFGEYRLVYKNISKVKVKQELQAGLIINENKDQVDLEVNSGETKEFWINIYPSTSHFKLNNNNRVGN